jgi:electron transfer flavoprotein alpha/beta subunit
MKTLVCVKQVGSVADELEFTADGRAVDPDFLDYALNEWDACAVEAALTLRDDAGGGEVTAVTVGDDEADKVVQRALAMGADRGVRVELVTQDPLAVARALSTVADAEAPDLVLCGVQSADLANGAVGAALAGLLSLPFAGVAVAIERDGAGLQVERELEGGLRERLAVQLPAVVSVQTGINSPRYVNFRQLKAAEATAIEVRGGDDAPGASGWQMAEPPAGEGAEMLAGRAPEVAARILELVSERRS